MSSPPVPRFVHGLLLLTGRLDDRRWQQLDAGEFELGRAAQLLAQLGWWGGSASALSAPRRYAEAVAEEREDPSAALFGAMGEFSQRLLANNDPFELITTAVTAERFIREPELRAHGRQIPISRIEGALNLPVSASSGTGRSLEGPLGVNAVCLSLGPERNVVRAVRCNDRRRCRRAAQSR